MLLKYQLYNTTHTLGIKIKNSKLQWRQWLYRETDQNCGCAGVVLLYCSDLILHRRRLEVSDEVEVQRGVAAVGDDGDMGHVCSDEQPRQQHTDTGLELRELTRPVVGLVDHDHQVQRRAAYL